LRCKRHDFLVGPQNRRLRDRRNEVKALYRNVGARKELVQAFLRHVDIAAAAETDRDLLRCVQGESALHETAH
jgi:hypothetical protein